MDESGFPGTRQTHDDGAYDHLERGQEIPHIRLPATTGETLDVVADAELTVLFLYPATGEPGRPLPEGWLEIPGAYGCTAETCGFRDLVGEFAAVGAVLRGVSTQTPAEQAAFASREGITFPLLSDVQGRLTAALDLPTFSAGDSPPRIRRATLVVCRDRRLRHCLYPVPDPADHPNRALSLIRTTKTT